MEVASNVPAWKLENMLTQGAALVTVSDFTAQNGYINFNSACLTAQNKESKLSPYRAAM